MVGISRIEARPTTGLFAFSDLGADFFVKIQKGTSEKVHMGVPLDCGKIGAPCVARFGIADQITTPAIFVVRLAIIPILP